MNEAKLRRCRQCGELKIETKFRPYYGGRKGRYRTCLDCEKINTRYKYLNKKLNENKITEPEEQELKLIDQLYDVLRERGFKPPAKKQEEESIMSSVSSLLEKHTAAIEATKSVSPVVSASTPPELLEWLTVDLSGYKPDYLQDEVIDQLYAKYRPQIGIDPERLVPIHDETHKDVLREIADRFDDYEDNYDWGDQDD